jgi:predicted amidohydrolase
MNATSKKIGQYMALALQPVMRGAYRRSDIKINIEHIIELARAAVWLSAIELPVRLIAIPEGALQGFTDEIFDWDHRRYVDELAIDVPGEETALLGGLAREMSAYVVAQAKVRHPDFAERFFNCAFVIDPTGNVIHKHYKLQVFAREHSTVPHDVWDRWTELYGTGLDAFYPVVDTQIGRIGCVICMEGSYPETARGLAMNGAEIIYRPSYPEPFVCRSAQSGLVLPDARNEIAARHVRRQDHDRRLPGTHRVPARLRRRRLLRGRNSQYRCATRVSCALAVGKLAQGPADRTVSPHL